MASTIDIEVNLDSKKALKGLEKLEDAGESVGSAVGESFNSMGQAVGKLGGEMNENLGAMGESLGGLSGAFVELSNVAKAPGVSFMSLLGPIGAVVIAITELAKAFDDYTGKTREAEIRVESYKAATAELTAAVEELAAAQIKLDDAQIKQLRTASLRAKIPLEESQRISENIGDLREQVEQIKIKMRAEQEAGNVTVSLGNQETAFAQRTIKMKRTESRAFKALEKQKDKLYAKIQFNEKRVLQLAEKGALATVEFEKLKQDLLKLSPEFRKKIYEQEQKLIHQARIDSLQGAEDAEKAQIKIARLQSLQKIKEIRAIEDISRRVKAHAIIMEEKRLGAEVTAIEKSFADKRASARLARAKQKATEKKIEDAKRLMQERQTENELFAIRSLEIQKMKQLGATKLQILEAQYKLEVDKAKENRNLELMALMRFEMAKTELLKSEEAKRQAERDKRQAEILKQIDERTQREQAYIDQAGEIADAFGGAFAEASFGALAMGESFKESIAQIIFGLGKQAAVESLISTAKMFSALAMGDLVGAANNLKAATGFAAGAVAAGVAGSALAGGGGGGGGSASPSGAPQIAPTPERESAQETSTVFNINFGGAVIYDTKQAAERAMVDRLVGVMNQRNRGARRLNLGRS